MSSEVATTNRELRLQYFASATFAAVNIRDSSDNVTVTELCTNWRECCRDKISFTATELSHGCCCFGGYLLQLQNCSKFVAAANVLCVVEGLNVKTIKKIKK